MIKKLGIIIFLTAMLTASGSSAQLPKTINYQGILTDNGGTVVTDGSYNLTLRLYTVPTGGSHIWECTEAVTVTKGIFNAVLGKTCVLTPSFDDQYYLGISVEGGAELTPRTVLSAAAYSLNSMAVTGTNNIFPATGNVGIGITSPLEKLHVNGAINLGSSSARNAGTIQWDGMDFVGYDGSSWLSLTPSSNFLPSGISGQTLRHNGTIWTASDLLTNDETTIKIGSNTQDGLLELFENGITNPIASISKYSPGGGQYGGYLQLFDETGIEIASLKPDNDGEGGYFAVWSSTSTHGFRVNGDYANGNTRVSIFGNSKSAIFNMDNTDDNSVELPVNSISNSEILDEPGVASKNESFSTMLGDDFTVITSSSITVPASGYVLVLASGGIQIQHIPGATSTAIVGVSDNSYSLSGTQDIWVGCSAATNVSLLWMPVAAHGLYAASAGTHTYYYVGMRTSTSGEFFVNNAQLSLVYFPTSYGTVAPLIADNGRSSEESSTVSPGMTAADIASERFASIADNNARMERELAGMRKRMERLEREMDNNR